MCLSLKPPDYYSSKQFICFSVVVLHSPQLSSQGVFPRPSPTRWIETQGMRGMEIDKRVRAIL
jgi:hypothetical protein